ncbi:MAG: peptidoglycan-binding domain-containing protein [Synechococcus sp.]
MGIAGRAYGVKAGSERLRLARTINNDFYNVRFRISKSKKLFPNGIISFFPRFACSLEQQALTGGKVPKGNCYAIIKIPRKPSNIDLEKAIAQNHRNSQSLGWKAYQSSIHALLGLSEAIPTSEEVARKIAVWQQSKTGLTVDGILGRKTLARMQRTLKKARYYGSLNQGPLLDRKQALSTHSLQRRATLRTRSAFIDTGDPYVIHSRVFGIPEGHERLTRDAAASVSGLTSADRNALRKGVRRVDSGNPLKHFDPKQQARHAIRRRTCQSQRNALKEIRDRLHSLHGSSLRARTRKTSFEMMGEALHLIQDSYSEAHIERQWGGAGASHPIVWIRFFGFDGSHRFPLEHRVFPPPDPRDIITTTSGALKPWALEAINASREFITMMLGHLANPRAANIGRELRIYMDKHLVLSRSHIPTRRHYPTCP